MFRRSVFLAATLFLLAAKFSAAQDTIPASEILKVWEKTAIKNAKFRFETISRRFADLPAHDPFSGEELERPKDVKLITVYNGSFAFAENLGAKLQYDELNRGIFNVFRDEGKSIYKHKGELIYSVGLDRKGESQLESLAIYEAFYLWLDPSAARQTKPVRHLGDKKLPITKDEKGHERVELGKLTLAKEFDWRVVQIAQSQKEATPPLYDFQFERDENGSLLLKSCVFTMLLGATKELSVSSEWSVSSLKLDEIVEKDISIETPAPALVHDNTVVPNREFFLRKDGSKTPYSSKEHYKLLDEIKAEKSKAESK